MKAEVGDRITLESNRVGGGTRTGEVVEVISREAGEHYRIRWDDGHETVLFPSSDATVERTTRSTRRHHAGCGARRAVRRR